MSFPPHWTKAHEATIMTQFDNQPAAFVVYPQPWQGTVMNFYFEDRRYTNEGTIVFDAQTGALQLSTKLPYNTLMPAESVGPYFQSILAIFLDCYRFGYSAPASVVPAYDHAYHVRMGYHDQNFDRDVKQWQADLVVKLLHSRKILVAGCSLGGLVVSLVERGVDAHGFDIMPDLLSHVPVACRDRVREGSVSEIPYSPADQFDALVAIDVLEHVPESAIAGMIAEWKRLNVSRVLVMINLNEFHFEGHVTLRPLTWWQKQWHDDFEIETIFRLEHEMLYKNDNDDNHQWIVLRRAGAIA